MPIDTKQPSKFKLPPTFQQAPGNVPVVIAPAKSSPALQSLATMPRGDSKFKAPVIATTAPERDYLLLDRSGSMSDKWSEALQAINGYVHTLGSRVNTRIMMAAFDDEYGVLRKELHPLQWRAITKEELGPRGGTALNDAIGSIVAQAKRDNPDKAAIVIMTDGGENGSKEITDEQALALLDECRAKGWQVIFLGIGHDNSELAQHYGADPTQTIAADKQSLAVTLQQAAEKRATYSRSGLRISFSATEKREAAPKLLR
jgi:hypothetical protein